jgi:hypothetical protein
MGGRVNHRNPATIINQMLADDKIDFASKLAAITGIPLGGILCFRRGGRS